MAEKKAESKEKHYFIVNPAGCIHEVDYDHAKMRLKQVGYRVATANEIAQYRAAKVQTAARPIAKPWSPEPEPEPELKAE